jgi:hypothetical protein
MPQYLTPDSNTGFQSLQRRILLVDFLEFARDLSAPSEAIFLRHQVKG